MKVKFVLFLLAAVAPAPAGDAAGLNGKWQIHIAVADRESDEECTFTQTGNVLRGTCTSDRGDGSISGKIEDQKVSWTYKTKSESGDSLTLTFTGTLNSETAMSGSLNVEEYGIPGEFTGTQAK